MEDQPHILIVGGGAGGLELAIRLARRTGRGRRARITLVDRHDTHIWKPRYHEIAVGRLVPADEEASYAAQAKRHGFVFTLGAMTALDPEARVFDLAEVRFPDDVKDMAGTELLPSRQLRYDQAVLALGSTVNDFGTPGVAEHCYTVDSVQSAEALHRAVRAMAERLAGGHADRVRVLIVGAGTTGVELAAGLRSSARELRAFTSLMAPDRLEVTLLEAADRPLPGVDESVSREARSMLEQHGVQMRFGAKATKVEAGALETENGERIEADIIVWASGVRGHSLAKSISGLELDKSERILVDPCLRTLVEGGGTRDTLYAMGDCASCTEPGQKQPVGATAQAAKQQSELLARSLAGVIAGKPPLPFHYRYRGTLISLGESHAVGDVPSPGKSSVRISGLPARLAYISLYRMHLVELFGWWRTAGLTIGSLIRRTALPSVKLDWN